MFLHFVIFSTVSKLKIMTENQKLRNENKKLLEALKDANSLITANIESFKLDTPKYWNITKILEDRGYKVNGILNYFR